VLTAFGVPNCLRERQTNATADALIGHLAKESSAAALISAQFLHIGLFVTLPITNPGLSSR